MSIQCNHHTNNEPQTSIVRHHHTNNGVTKHIHRDEKIEIKYKGEHPVMAIEALKAEAEADEVEDYDNMSAERAAQLQVSIFKGAIALQYLY